MKDKLQAEDSEEDDPRDDEIGGYLFGKSCDLEKLDEAMVSNVDITAVLDFLIIVFTIKKHDNFLFRLRKRIMSC